MTRGELIAALEKAEGPSRELDGRIAISLGWHPTGVSYRWRSPECERNGTVDLPLYTSSIDAAITLTPEGFTVHTIHHGTKQWDVSLCLVGDCGLATWDAAHKNLPLALCVASLRARE